MVEWETRGVEVAVLIRAWGFESPFGYHADVVERKTRMAQNHVPSPA
jgi:hypothetical protein